MEKTKKIENFLAKNIRWILLTIFAIILLEIVENLFQNEIHIFDDTIYYYVSKIINPVMTVIAKVITTVGSGYVIIPVWIISIIVFRKRKESKYIFVNLGLIFIVNQLLKMIIARPRPEGYRIVEESGYSFPSGHSMVSMAFYGLFIYLIYANVKNIYLKWISIIALIIMVVLIGLSRIYLGVHYASDVIAGFCISVCYLTIFTKAIDNN